MGGSGGSGRVGGLGKGAGERDLAGLALDGALGRVHARRAGDGRLRVEALRGGREAVRAVDAQAPLVPQLRGQLACARGWARRLSSVAPLPSVGCVCVCARACVQRGQVDGPEQRQTRTKETIDLRIRSMKATL